MAADVQDRVALVTGSTRGIGAAIARRLGRAGARVVITGRSKDAGETLAGELRAAGGAALFVPMDIGVEDDVRNAVDAAVAEFGGLDILVNNAAPTDHIIGGWTSG
jgi:NAD(P)-dependent dehydrogenase (short-subunit alcohol dehydrogenase family)